MAAGGSIFNAMLQEFDGAARVLGLERLQLARLGDLGQQREVGVDDVRRDEHVEEAVLRAARGRL